MAGAGVELRLLGTATAFFLPVPFWLDPGAMVASDQSYVENSIDEITECDAMLWIVEEMPASVQGAIDWRAIGT